MTVNFSGNVKSGAIAVIIADVIPLWGWYFEFGFIFAGRLKKSSNVCHV